MDDELTLDEFDDCRVARGILDGEMRREVVCIAEIGRPRRGDAKVSSTMSFDDFLYGCKIVENILGPVHIGQRRPIIRRSELTFVQNEQMGRQARFIETVCGAALE